MYGIKYKVPFKTLSGRDSVVTLEERGYAGSVIELKAGGDPFNISVDQADLLSPIRSSTATLAVVGSDYLQDLYANDPQGIRVKCEVDGVVKWLGYLLPDTFSQDFSSPEFEYDMELVAALSTLKYREFDLTDDFVTFRQIIEKAVEYSGYEAIYLTNSVRPETGKFYDLKISSANFFDELGEASTYYEALEEIAKYLGCCFVPHEDDLYLLDYAAIRKGFNSYTRILGSSVSNVTLSDAKVVDNYRGTGAKISRIAGKNKATVKSSLYEIKNILPVFDDERAELYSTHPIDTIEKEITVGKEKQTQVGIIRYYRQPKFTFYHQILTGSTFTEHEGDIFTSTHEDTLGSCFVRTTSYNEAEKPTSLRFDNEVLVENYIYKSLSPVYDPHSFHELNSNHRVISLKSNSRALYHKDVYLCISAQVKFNQEKFDPVQSDVHKFGADLAINIPVKFRIGKYYYNGTTWTETESKFNLPVDVKKGDSVLGRYFKVRNTNDFTLGIGDINGYVIKAPDFNVMGDCELTIYYFTTGQTNIIGNAFSYIKDIQLNYGIPDEQSIYGDWVDEDSTNDLLYENVIDDGYIDEAEEINLKICTNTDGKLALSSVIEGDVFLKTLVSDVYGEDLPEHLLLDRVVDIFKKPRFVIDPTLKDNAKPYTLFTEPHLGKTFLLAGGEIDAKRESATYNLIEL